MTYKRIMEQLHRLERVETELLIAAQEEAEAQGDTEMVEKLMQFREERRLISIYLPHSLAPKGSGE